MQAPSTTIDAYARPRSAKSTPRVNRSFVGGAWMKHEFDEDEKPKPKVVAATEPAPWAKPMAEYEL